MDSAEAPVPTPDPVLLEAVLETAVELLGSDAGSVQIIDARGGGLRLVASRGFHERSAAFWAFVPTVPTGTAATCGAALGLGRRVVVEDVEQVDAFAGSDDLREWRRSSVRAVQSTPLRARDGRVVGMLSTHWREAYLPSAAQLRAVDPLARMVDPDHVVVRCAWCGRMELDRQFHPAVELPRGNPLFRYRVSHGICPDCRAAQFDSVGASPPP